MHCCYINLDRATQRRVDIEASFHRAARPGWTLQRFPAVDGDHVERERVPGRRSRAEKACYMSHRAVIEAHRDRGQPLLVLEDDVQFGAATCEIVDGFLQQNTGADWDLLFLDICAHRITDMLNLYFNREKLIRQRTVIPVDLSKLPFFGTCAYIVNAGAFDKVLACLDAGIPIDIEYDILLAHFVRERMLKAAVLFPFVTTLSPRAAASQIQRASVETVNLARNLFRNMVWLESDPAAYRDSMLRLEQAIAGAGHESLARVLAGICMAAGDAGSNSDPA
jgi:GR25 family glycosyltransferase involved in LPS biosynthesis